MEYLDILKQALVYILTIYWFYQMVISLCALVKLKDKPYITNKNHKFMAIIPAHNEEMVVANLIESLKNQLTNENPKISPKEHLENTKESYERSKNYLGNNFENLSYEQINNMAERQENQRRQIDQLSKDIDESGKYTL